MNEDWRSRSHRSEDKPDEDEVSYYTRPKPSLRWVIVACGAGIVAGLILAGGFNGKDGYVAELESRVEVLTVTNEESSRQIAQLQSDLDDADERWETERARLTQANDRLRTQLNEADAEAKRWL